MKVKVLASSYIKKSKAENENRGMKCEEEGEG
jgi:hypothetical protein